MAEQLEQAYDEIVQLDVNPLYIDPCAPLADFNQKEWISKEEALKLWPK